MLSQKNNFIILVTLSIILGYIASEIYLPALPALQHWLGSTTSQLQLTISIYFFGVGAAQLIGGPLIDRFNYRKIAIAMAILFILSSFACAISVALYQLIFVRLVQAFSAGILAIVGRASLIKKFPPEEVMRIYLYISPTLALSLSFSPFIGGYLTDFFGWPSVFYFVSFLGMILLLLIFRYLFINQDLTKAISIRPASIFKTYLSLIQNNAYLSAVIITSTVFAQHLAYLAETPFIFSKLHYHSQDIGKFYITISLAFVAGSWFTRRYLKRWSYHVLVYTGFASMFAGTFLILLLYLHGIEHAYEIFLPSLFLGFGNGILIPLGTGKAISLFPDKAGYASGFLSSTNLLIAAALASPVNYFTHSSAGLLALYMMLIISVGLASFWALSQSQ